MTYANLEDRRAYARAHYQANKDRYNPGRKLAQELASEARWRINHRISTLAEDIRLLSDTRWVGPTEIRRMCTVKGEVNIFNAVLLELERWSYLRDDIEHTGLLQRRAAFSKHDPNYGAFKLFAMSKRIPKDCRAELLILQLTINRKMTHGR